MDILFLLMVFGVIILLPTVYAAKTGAPYVPVFGDALKKVFDYLRVGEGDTVVDLGCGDGKVLVEASNRGANAVGYDLFPIVVLVSWLRSLGKKGMKVKMANFYSQKLPKETTIIFAFLVPDTMERLKKYLRGQDLSKVRAIVIYAFPFKDVEPVKTVYTPKCARMFVYEAGDIKDEPAVIS